MVLLKIDLQDGFEGDLVVVRVNDKEVFRKDGIKTRPMLGYADSMEADVPLGQSWVEIALPRKDIGETISLVVTAPVYLGLSISNGKIVQRLSQTFFAYL
jgi:hypothetical protein